LVGTWTLQLYDDIKGTVGTLNEWSITVTGASTLLAEANHGFSTPDAALLTQPDAEQAAIAALAMWAEQTQVVQPPAIDVQVTDLPAGQLGLAWGHTITLDVNGDGAGWHLDVEVPVAGQHDLLTVVTHEIGHLLGYGHSSDSHEVMASILPIGTRRLPVDMSVVRDNLSGFAGEASLLIPQLRLDVTEHDPVVDRILPSDVEGDNDSVNDMWLLPLLPADYVDLPRTSPEAVDVRLFDDITDEETELLDDDLLDLIAGQK
jgi:hypothetical protein